MKIDKKQLPQLIILGVLVVGFVGYLSFSVFKPKASAPPPEQNTTVSTGPAAEQPGIDQVAAAGVFPDLAGAETRRDPFAPQIAESQPTPASRPNASMPRTHVSNLTSGLPTLNPFKEGAGASGAPILPVAENDPEFVITGVIRGAENVAIIRVGEGERHVIKQGQLIDGRFKVLRVSDDGAVLAYKNRRIHLKLGGAKNAK